jgi:hypothetical protein
VRPYTPIPSAALLLLLLIATGCHHATDPGQLTADDRARMESQREQLDKIPPPTKSRYMAVHSFESWQNPYVTVNAGMLELHVTMADETPTAFGTGGLLRPVAARQQELNISMDALGDAMSAIPQTAWPYGRVVAIEEAHKTPTSAEPAVRRNMEVAINRLNMLGIVVYDISDGKID